MDIAKIEVGATHTITSRSGIPGHAEEVKVVGITDRGRVKCRHLHYPYEQFIVRPERIIKRTRPAPKFKKFVSERYGC